ncbi:MAG: hypothetical protein ACRCS8_03550 [Brevinema sp.]
MKKGLFILLIATTSLFGRELPDDYVAQAAEVVPINKSVFNRFGMTVLPMSFGFGANTPLFPISIVIANENNALITFGLETSTRSLKFWDNSTPKQYGVYIGGGKLYPSSRNNKIHMGYLFEFSGGYAPETIIGYPFYIGFHPQFVLETKSFLFTLGVYIDTSLIITPTIGLGFLI